MAASPTNREFARASLLTVAVWLGVWSLAPAETLDAKLWYPVTLPPRLLADLGESGREAYLVTALADLMLIAAYTRWLWMWSRRRRAPRWLQGRVWLAPGTFDLIETSGVLVMLGAFPDPVSAVTTFVTVATPFKWASAMGLVLGSVATMWHRRRTRASEELAS
ncbi:MAG: hypothetical protein B7733_15910 [Myxococcales bacterium FL481]|nr:MAG: hypothetical protein B7733_15910 [Myxococcales bacterium FL481]